MTDPPRVVLDIDVMWCRRHLEPFRAEWPVGYAVAMLELFSKAAAMPAVSDAAGADAANLAAALRRFAPVCCFVSADDLADVYKAAGIKP